MSYSATLGRWIQADPTGYVDGTNLYQYVRSLPTGKADPLGLMSVPSVVVIPPGFTFEIPLPDPCDSDFAENPFYLNNIQRPGWGLTDVDVDWNGEPGKPKKPSSALITTQLGRFVLPPNAPKCLQGKQAALDALNDRIKQHERDAQQWFKDELETPGITDEQFAKDRLNRFGGGSDWERSELGEMYALMKDLFADCCCDGKPSPFSKLLENRLKELPPPPQSNTMSCPA